MFEVITVQGSDGKDYTTTPAFQKIGLYFPLEGFHGTTKGFFERPRQDLIKAGPSSSVNGVGFYLAHHREVPWEYAGQGQVPGVILKATIPSPAGWLNSVETLAGSALKRLSTAARLIGSESVAERIERLQPGVATGADLFQVTNMQWNCDLQALAGYTGYYAAHDGNFVYFKADSVPDLTTDTVYHGLPVPPPKAEEATLEPVPFDGKTLCSEDLTAAWRAVQATGDVVLIEKFKTAAALLHSGEFAPDKNGVGFGARQGLGIAITRALRNGGVKHTNPIDQFVSGYDREAGVAVREAIDAARVAWGMTAAPHDLTLAGALHRVGSNWLTDLNDEIVGKAGREFAAPFRAAVVALGAVNDPTLARTLGEAFAEGVQRLVDTANPAKLRAAIALAHETAPQAVPALTGVVDAYAARWAFFRDTAARSIPGQVGWGYRPGRYDDFMKAMPFEGWERFRVALDKGGWDKVELKDNATVLVSYEDGRSLTFKHTGDILRYRDGKLLDYSFADPAVVRANGQTMHYMDHWGRGPEMVDDHTAELLWRDRAPRAPQAESGPAPGMRM